MQISDKSAHVAKCFVIFMQNFCMIVVTGAAGFIGSCLVSALNKRGFTKIIAVDDFSLIFKEQNLKGKQISAFIDRNSFFDWLKIHSQDVKAILHMGARTDTAEFNMELLNQLNLNYSKKMWNACVEYSIPLLYASSAATYGNGEFGYDDNHDIPFKLHPLNPYGISKNEFDKWVLQQKNEPPYWAGFKFFNVFGPNEYHKGRMASVVFHAFNQIKTSGEVKLFRSHRSEFKDGQQLRDFVYVKDVCDVLLFMLEKKSTKGIFNLGTGKARSFYDLAASVFSALSLSTNIQFIDIPADIRDKYQYYTQAEMQKLKDAGYPQHFSSLEDSVKDYVTNYLIGSKYF